MRRIRSPGAERLEQRPGDVEDLAGDVGRERQGAGPVEVRKSASRTLMDDRTAGLAGAAQPGADLGGQGEHRCRGSPPGRRRRRRRWSPRRSTSPRARYSPGGGPGPRPARAGGAAAASPTAARSMPERGLGHVADGPQPEPAQRLGGALAHAPQRRRPAAGAGTPAPGRPGTTIMPSGLARVEPSLATNFVDATPTEQVSRCSAATRAADQRRRSRPAAEQPRRAGHVEERLVDRQRLDQRGDVAEDRHHRPGRLARTRPCRAAGRSPAGRAAGPGCRAWRCARRTRGPRSWPSRPRRAARCRRR